MRCIGKEGDVVEIKNAVVYLNSKQLDEPYTWNEYYISLKQINSIQGYVDRYHYPSFFLKDSLYSITFSAAELKTYHLDLKRITLAKDSINTEIFQDFRKLKFNEDNLGPVTVPPNSYFVMGDNRHNALDSRYSGFIASNDIVSTVLQ